MSNEFQPQRTEFSQKLYERARSFRPHKLGQDGNSIPMSLPIGQFFDQRLVTTESSQKSLDRLNTDLANGPVITLFNHVDYQDPWLAGMWIAKYAYNVEEVVVPFGKYLLEKYPNLFIPTLKWLTEDLTDNLHMMPVVREKERRLGIEDNNESKKYLKLMSAIFKEGRAGTLMYQPPEAKRSKSRYRTSKVDSVVLKYLQKGHPVYNVVTKLSDGGVFDPSTWMMYVNGLLFPDEVSQGPQFEVYISDRWTFNKENTETEVRDKVNAHIHQVRGQGGPVRRLKYALADGLELVAKKFSHT